MKTLLLLIVVVIVAAAALVTTGAYNVAADDPHWPATEALLATVLDRSIAARAADLAPPDLGHATRIAGGAGNYDSMCVGCHLSPGTEETELSRGLYPRPPSWRDLGTADPREAFWVIKHGIKMTGMAAWGESMDDRYIWGMVAFMRQFPGMGEAQYEALVRASPGHSHGGGETDTDAGHVPADGEAAIGDAAPRSSFEPVDDPMAPDRGPAEHGANDHHDH
jgi:mono/diheme cytochrome c family protein